jgi:hypothetical protein
MKSPLKSNTHFNVLGELKKILKPKSKISSLYLYDGGVEVSLANLDFMILAHTNKKCIFEFWHTVLKEPQRLAEMVQHYLSFIDDGQLYSFQKDWHTNRNKMIRSILFYILNNSSDLYYPSCGNIDKTKITPFMISKLKTLTVNNFFPFFDSDIDSLDCLDKIGDVDYVLLPIGEYSLNLFELGKNKGPEMYTYKHKEIQARARDLDKKCILLYKNHPALFNLYKSFNIKMVDKYGRVADKKESCGDLIITNF